MILENLTELFLNFKDYLIDKYHYNSTVFIVNCIIIATAILLTFTGYFIIIFHRIINYYHLKRKKEIINQLNELLIETVMNTSDLLDFNSLEIAEPVTLFKKKWLNNTFNKQLVINELHTLHKNFAGITAQNIQLLYLELGLKKESIKMLSRTGWHNKANAIRDLARFSASDTVELIARYINSSNHILRLEAQVGYLKLNQEHPFSFLNDINEPMSEWHQLNLSNAVTQFDRLEIPSFSKWFNSSNESVVQFAIKMVTHFRQLNATDELVQLFNHTSPQIRNESIKALGVLQAEEVNSDLLEYYEIASHEEKCLLLDTLGKIASEKNIEFIEKQVSNPDFEIAFHAALALKEYGQIGLDKFKQLKLKTNTQSKSIIAHVLDNRIYHG